ncbi:hypothetical protein ASPFODRAFT_537735 [Aspergillus luchuensis CBS 106.47]|uniref:Uncharacterized protein n=1 Tax=Aspergillus luchuensis (strain CBS 106.47) TaxID=1137211 RepID=A0A1M3TNZ8_ASPLC|nr:hypothetical protein ASPFODRAFT_537735 [Aspergillus luchuensis CBS 106.47]
MTLTRILPPSLRRRRTTHLIHRPGGRWIRYGMLLCGTVRSKEQARQSTSQVTRGGASSCFWWCRAQLSGT